MKSERDVPVRFFTAAVLVDGALPGQTCRVCVRDDDRGQHCDALFSKSDHHSALPSFYSPSPLSYLLARLLPLV